MADVFISYNREDKSRARAIATSLEAEGLTVWWDSNLKAGDSYDEVTEKNLREAGAVVVLWSTRSVVSKWVRAEATIGERSSVLVPAMIEECDRPLRFELIQAADLIHWHGEQNDPNWRTFVHDIKSAVGANNTANETAAPVADQAPSASQPEDITIENTFWTSIKDGSDRSDFEAYLSRYPDGHFAVLAQNRIAALNKTAAARPKPSTEPLLTPKQNPRTAPAAHKTPPQKRVAAKKAPPPKENSNGMLFGLLGLALVALGMGIFFLLGPKKEEKLTAVNAEATAEPEIETASVSSSKKEEAAPSAPSNDRVATIEKTSLAKDTDDIDLENSNFGDASNSQPAEENQADDAPSSVKNSSPSSLGVFKDCEQCPEMKILPAGTFVMGSPTTEANRFAYEGPQRNVVVPSFAIGVYEVTHDQWTACVDDGGCNSYTPTDSGFGRGSRPAIAISWNDAKAFTAWLSKKTNKTYRLPTEAEWEYAARGGSATAYWWGREFNRNFVLLGKTAEAGSFSENKFGLHDMTGNASEWVEDCYINNFTKAPTDGTAVLNGDCGRRVVRGGSWRSKPSELRVANRGRITRATRDRSLGFRIVAEVN